MTLETLGAVIERGPLHLISAEPDSPTSELLPAPSGERVTPPTEGDRRNLITRHMSLVEHAARRFGARLPASLGREDLVGYGMIGLIEAVDRFDPAIGVKFETFATRRIWGAMVDAVRGQGFLPRSALRRVREVNEASATLEQELSRVPTIDEVAQRLASDARSVEEAYCTAQVGVVSLDAVVGDAGDGDGVTLYDVLADDSEDLATRMEDAEEVEVVAREIEALPERERLAISLYYHEELAFREIGRVLGVSESRACQLHAAAIQRLRAALVLSRPTRLSRGRQSSPRESARDWSGRSTCVTTGSTVRGIAVAPSRLGRDPEPPFDCVKNQRGTFEGSLLAPRPSSCRAGLSLRIG